jgi:putative LysE/RhtB family amino acid efflux pump
VTSLLTGLGFGLVIAAQIGPVSLLIVRSVLRGALVTGLAMAAAVSLVDLLYAALGLAGAGRLLDAADAIRVGFGLVGAAILVAIGVRTLWTGIRARLGLETLAEVATPARAFSTALAATAFKPLTIVLWTAAFPAAQAGADRPLPATALLLAGVAAGSLAWYCGFSAGVALLRRRVGPRLLAVVDVGSGAGLVGYGGLFAYRTLRDR